MVMLETYCVPESENAREIDNTAFLVEVGRTVAACNGIKPSNRSPEAWRLTQRWMCLRPVQGS
jgi:hypothetical protein